MGAEGTLTDARGAEMKSKHEFEMLKSSLEQELKTMKKRMSAASAEKAGTEKTMSDASEELATTEKTLDADTKYLSELRMSCSKKAEEWEQRQKDAGEEMAAIAKAKEILTEGVKVFLQVKSTLKDDDEDSNVRNQVASILKKIAKKTPAFALTQLVSAAKSDTFGKIKGLIESMIDRLEKEAAEEADAQAFCTTETEKSKAKQADLTAKLDMHAKVRIRLSRTRPVNYRRLYSVFTNPIGNPARVRNVPWQNGRPWAFSLKLAVDAIRRGRLRTHIDVSAEMMPPEPAVGGT